MLYIRLYINTLYILKNKQTLKTETLINKMKKYQNPKQL